MAQRLIFPFNKAMIICGYKTSAYKSYWGYDHYGIDISSYQGGQSNSNHLIRASGDGTVLAVGKDNTLGYGICIKYENCVSRDGDIETVVARYMHMSNALVSVGENVQAGQAIADEGKEGTTSYHLHLELDTDVKFPLYTPQVSLNHTFWKKGKDTTLNPSLWLYQDSDHKTVPYNFGNRAWIIDGVDDNIPSIDDSDTLERVRELVNELYKILFHY